MPKLLVEAKKNLDRTEKTLILVATSGDTGKAALDGYHDIPGVEIAVFFPTGGTSEIQRLQMVTQEGENVAVYAVRGNFDDAQTGVKKVFGDPAIAAELAKRNIRLSSANSINWGRLVRQIVYYFAAYAQLLKAGKVRFGDKVDFCVPTGNFGDILAGYYAKQMGLPVGRLICASNENNVLTDFLTTGTYTAKREFFKTTSPSMDILVSSNLERLLYHVTGSDAEVAGLMKSLSETGSYTVRPETLAAIQESFGCGWSSEEEVAGEIRARYEQDGYLCDTHPAVALHVAGRHKREGHAGAGSSHRPHCTRKPCCPAAEGRAVQYRHRPGADCAGGAKLSGINLVLPDLEQEKNEWHFMCLAIPIFHWALPNPWMFFRGGTAMWSGWSATGAS